MENVKVKFIILWIIVITCVYTCTGYFYLEEINIDSETEGIQVIDKPQGQMYINNSDIQEVQDENQEWWDVLFQFLGLVFDLVIGLIKVTFFILPQVPPIVILAVNIIIQPLNIAFLLCIYPIIENLMDKILKIIDILVPDWL